MIGINLIESECMEYLLSLGYEVYKPGWPDFLCIKNKEIIAIEAKSPNDKLKSHQKQTIKILEKIGLPVFIYKNKELKDIKGQNIQIKKSLKTISEILRLEYETKLLINIKEFYKNYKTLSVVAEKMGMSRRRLNYLIERYKLTKNPDKWFLNVNTFNLEQSNNNEQK